MPTIYLGSSTGSNALGGYRFLENSEQTSAKFADGWIVSTGSTGTSPYKVDVEQAASTFTGTHPDGTLTDDFFTWRPAAQTIPAGDWTFNFSVQADTNGGAADGRVLFRVYKGTTTTQGTLVSAGTVTASTVTNVATSGTFESVATISLAEMVFTSLQALHVEIAWERTGAGGMSSSDIHFRSGSAGPAGTYVTYPAAAQALTPSLFSSTNTFHAATVSVQQNLTQSSSLSNSQTFYGHTTSAGAYDLVTPLVTNSEAFYAATVTRGAVGLTPTRLDNSTTFFAATVYTPAQEIYPWDIASTNYFFGDYLRTPNDLASGVWTVPGSGVFVSDSERAPDGTMTGDRFDEVPSATSTYTFRQVLRENRFFAGRTYTVQLYYKYRKRRYLSIRLSETLGVSAVVDLAFNTWASAPALQGGSSGSVSGAIEDAPFTWKKVTITWEPSADETIFPGFDNFTLRLLKDYPETNHVGDTETGVCLWGVNVLDGVASSATISDGGTQALVAGSDAVIHSSSQHPLYTQTRLLMRFEGPDNSTVYTDESRYARAFTRTGTGTGVVSTDSPLRGLGSYKADHAISEASQLQTTDVADISLPGDFTISFSAKRSYSNDDYMPVRAITGDPSRYWQIGLSSAFGFSVSTQNVGVGATALLSYPISSGELADNTRHRYDVTREGTTVRMFIDGVIVASGTMWGDAGAFTSTATTLEVAVESTNTAATSYLDDLVIVDGTALYTANFTPPTAGLGGRYTGENVATITLGAPDLGPPLLTNTSTFPSATVAGGAVTLTPELLANSQTFYAPTVAVAGATDLQPSLLTNSQAFYALVAAPGTVGLTPTLVGSAETFFGATLLSETLVQPALVPDENSIFVPGVIPGDAALLPSFFDGAEDFFAPTVVAVLGAIGARRVYQLAEPHQAGAAATPYGAAVPVSSFRAAVSATAYQTVVPAGSTSATQPADDDRSTAVSVQ